MKRSSKAGETDETIQSKLFSHHNLVSTLEVTILPQRKICLRYKVNILNLSLCSTSLIDSFWEYLQQVKPLEHWDRCENLLKFPPIGHTDRMESMQSIGEREKC